MKIVLKNRHKHGGEWHKAGSVVDWPEEVATDLVAKGSATVDMSYKARSAPHAVEVPKVDLEQNAKRGKK